MSFKKFSTTKLTALSSAMTSGDVTVLLVDGSSYPDPAVGGNGPYTVLLGYGSDREEIVTVTAKPSTHVLTVTRAEDGSAATAKNLGDVVVHGVSKRDWEDLLPKVGGTVTGAITLPGAPTADLHAATKKYVDDSIGAWQSYVPTLAQGATANIAKTVSTARYIQIGKTVHCHVRLIATGTGTLGEQISVSLPVTAAAAYATVGSGLYLDAGTGLYAGVAALNAATHVLLYKDEAASSLAVGASPSIAVAATDEVRFIITYEAA